MDKNKIEKLEKKIKKMHLNPAQGDLKGFDWEMRKEYLSGFWEYHVQKVVEYADKLAKKYNADGDIAHLGALLHDISLVDDEKMHDALGAIKAKKILLEEGFDEETAQKVSDIALKHRCQKFVPETLEEKIVATADTMSHFLPSYYLGIAVIAREDYANVVAKKNIEKLEQSYREKIFFEDERKEFQGKIKEFRKWFGN